MILDILHITWSEKEYVIRDFKFISIKNVYVTREFK